MVDDARALEELTSEIRYMNEALRVYTNAVMDITIKSGHAEAAGRASAPHGSVGGGILDQHGNLIKDNTKVMREEIDARRKSIGAMSDDFKKLGELQMKIQEMDKEWAEQKRILAESNRVTEAEIEARKENIKGMEWVNERNKAIADRDAELKRHGMTAVGDTESPKGILAQIKDHYIKSDAFTKQALLGLGVTGGIMALDYAWNAIKTFGSKVKDTALEMNKDVRANLTSAYQAYGAGQIGGAGRFLGQQMTGMQQEVSKNAFFQAAGVKGDDFIKALTDASRRLNLNTADTVESTKAIADFTVRAHVAGVSLKEYEDTVISLTHTAGIGIENQKKARDLADQIYETEKTEHLERGFLLNNIKSTYQALATMGYTIDNVTSINVRFAKQIQEGTMSLNDIILYAKGMKDANQGQHLFAIQSMQQFGSADQKAFARKAAELSGGDPLKAATIMRGISEGYMPIASQFGFKSSAEAAEFYKKAMNDTMFGFARAYFGVSGTDRGSVDYLRILPELAKMFGMAIPTETLEKMAQYAKDPSFLGGKGLDKPKPEQFDIAAKQLAGLTTLNETADRIYNTLVFDIANKLTGVDSTVMNDLQNLAKAGKGGELATRYSWLPSEARENPLVSSAVRRIVSENAESLAKSMNVSITVDGSKVPPDILAEQLWAIVSRKATTEGQIRVDAKKNKPVNNSYGTAK